MKLGFGVQVLFFLSSASAATFQDYSSQRVLVKGDPVIENKIFRTIIDEGFSKKVEKLLEEHEARGVALTIVSRTRREDGEIFDRIETGSWGNATEDGDPVTNQTIFDIASCSKAFTVSALGILMDDFAQGRNVTPLPQELKSFDFSTKLKAILPEDWLMKDQWMDQRTSIRDILSHVSGMPSQDFAIAETDSIQDVVRLMRHHNSPLELRQRFAYNNLMYIVATHIINLYSGTSYMDFVQKRIFVPSGMKWTTYSPTEAQETGRFSEVWAESGRRISYLLNDHGAEVTGGAGGVLSNGEDLSQWIRVLLNHGVHPSTHETIIPRWVFEEVTTASTIVEGNDVENILSIEGYGMGWFRKSYRGRDLVSHTGSYPGFRTTVAFLPHDDLGIAVTSNWDGGSIVNRLMTYLVIDKALQLGDNLEDNIRLLNEEALIGRSNEKGIPLPSHPTLSLSLKAYTGTYTSPGYPPIILCARNIAVEFDSDLCSAIRSDYSDIDKAANRTPRTAELLARLPSLGFMVNGLRLVHVAEDTFELVPSVLFPQGYGKNKTPFAYGEEGLLADEPRNGTFPEGIAIFDIGEAIKADSKSGEVSVVRGVSLFGIVRDVVENGHQWVGTGRAKDNALVYYEKL